MYHTPRFHSFQSTGFIAWLTCVASMHVCMHVYMHVCVHACMCGMCKCICATSYSLQCAHASYNVIPWTPWMGQCQHTSGSWLPHLCRDCGSRRCHGNRIVYCHMGSRTSSHNSDTRTIVGFCNTLVYIIVLCVMHACIESCVCIICMCMVLSWCMQYVCVWCWSSCVYARAVREVHVYSGHTSHA